MNKFEKITAQISKKVFNREEEIGIILTTIISGYNACLIGNAGSGKTMLAEEILSHFSGSKFNALLHPFSDPSDLLGEFDLRAMKHGRRIRNTANTIVESDYAFIDEIFKARSSTLTALLKILNERQYIEEGKSRKVDLKGIIGASNEFSDDESGAIADRFRIYLPINNLGSKLSDSIHLIWANFEESEKELIELPYVNVCRKKMKALLRIEGKTLFDSLVKLNERFDKSGASVLSDRSLIQACEMIAMSAVLSGRKETNLNDFHCVKYMAKDFDIDYPIYNNIISEFINNDTIVSALKANIKKSTSKAKLSGLLNDIENQNFPFYISIKLKTDIKNKLFSL